MALQLKTVTREARAWPRDQRLALVRVLLEPESGNNTGAVETAWNGEIRARLRAVEECRTHSVDYAEVRVEMQARFAR